MPPILHLALAYEAGLWTGLVLLIPAAAQWTAVGVGTLAVWGGRWRGLLVAVAAVGLLTGAVHAARRRATCAAVWSPGAVRFSGRLHDAPGERGTTSASVHHAAGPCRGAVRLRLGERGIPAGVRVLVVGQHRGRGVVRVTHLRVLRGGGSLRYRVRDTVIRRIRALYGPRAPVVEAMLVGRRDDLPPAERARFVEAGIAHLLAISGLHVGIVAGWLVLAARWVGLRSLAWPAGVLGTWLYVALLGFPAPATRAATFVLLHAVARARQRHPPAAAVLAVSVLVVTAVDPGAATAVGAWLSVAAVWGTTRGPRWLPQAARRSAPLRLLVGSGGAILATAPITAFAFGSVAPVGILTNLAAIPLVGVLVPGVFASLLVGGPIAAGAGALLAALERVAALAATVPGGHLSGPPGPAFALPWAALLTLAVWIPGRGAWRRVRRVAWAAAGVSWIAAAGVGRPQAPSGMLELHVLDVGQGDAIALRTPGGQWLLVDAGPRTPGRDAGRDVVVPFLRAQGARRLAALVVSHGDADHVGGVPAVMEALEVGVLVEPGQPLATPLYRETLAAVDAAGIGWRAARAGDSLVVDGVTLRVLHPSADWMAGELDPNENSVVLMVAFGCFEGLLVGDLGVPAERALLGRVPDVDLLKVGHHGSAGSTSEAWLTAVRPEVAVVSVGPNGYGHPSPEVLARLARRGIVIWRTDRGGTVTIRTDGRYLTIGQGETTSLGEGLRCRIRRLLRSSDSSSSRRSCTPRPPVSSPMCSTTSPLRPR